MFGEELNCVGGALAELPYEQREAVVLRLCSGMRFQAIVPNARASQRIRPKAVTATAWTN